MQRPDELKVTRDQNPALLEAIRNKALGDKVVAEAHLILKSQDAEGALFTIGAMVPEGYEIDKTATDMPMNSSDATMTPMAMQVRRIQNKPQRTRYP